MASITFKTDDSTKEQFNLFCNETGLNMSVALNMFMKAVLKEKCIPFEIGVKKPNLETLMAIEEAERIAKDPNTKSYKSVEEAFKDVLGEDY